MKKFTAWTIALILFLPIGSWAQGTGEIQKEKEKKPELGGTIDLEATEFKNETRAGLIFSTGNTGSLAVSGSHMTKYRFKRYENNVRLGVHYNRITSTTGNVATGTTARYLFGTYRLDYYFLDKTTVYGGGGGYTDEIKGIETAGEGFTGLAHYFYREAALDLGISGGYNFTYEDRLPPALNAQIHSATAGFVYRQDLNKQLVASHKIDFQENVEDTGDLRFQSQNDLKIKLNELLALIVGFSLRFDREPVPGFKKLDTLTDLSLSISF